MWRTDCRGNPEGSREIREEAGMSVQRADGARINEVAMVMEGVA
jgi:hypothetical protein